MMTEQSLRPMTLVFIIQVLFDATFTLNCSRFIGFCRKLYLISLVAQKRTFIHFRAELLRWIAAFSRKLIFEWSDFRLSLSTQNSFIKTFERFSLWIRSTSDSFEKILVPISSHDHSFWIFIQPFDITYFRQHLHNLISEGTTNLWAEYNDGCVQRGGIHSPLFVFICLIIFIFL